MSRKFISIILIFSTLIVVIGLCIYFLTSYSYLKEISLINFYDKELTVNLNGRVYILEPFDTKLIRIKDLRHLGITARIETNVVYSRSIQLPFNTQILGFYFSEVDHCYYKTNLSTDAATLTFSKMETPSNYLVVDEPDYDKNSFFLPGTSKSDLDSSKELVGYLPLLCTGIEDVNTILDNNKLFLNYNAELQRKYFFEKVDDINNSNNLTDLGDVKGVEKNRLEYFNFGGDHVIFIPGEE